MTGRQLGGGVTPMKTRLQMDRKARTQCASNAPWKSKGIVVTGRDHTKSSLSRNGLPPIIIIRYVTAVVRLPRKWIRCAHIYVESSKVHHFSRAVYVGPRDMTSNKD
jgi:hypothetical protein